MNYEEGVEHMKDLCCELTKGEKRDFNVGVLKIEYPGYKKLGDYRLSKNGTAPTHINIVKGIYDLTTINNLCNLSAALEDIFINGLNSTNTFFTQSQKELIYWITLQEEINYPQPRYSGRKLPFQRFFEGALAKLGYLSIQSVYDRTNNRGGSRPALLNLNGINRPIFYI